MEDDNIDSLDRNNTRHSNSSLVVPYLPSFSMAPPSTSVLHHISIGSSSFISPYPKVLKDRRFPVTLETLRLFASERSAGKTLSTPYGEKKIELFSVEAARECDFVFLAVSGTFALQYAKKISEKGGPYVIDNSSAFR